VAGYLGDQSDGVPKGIRTPVTAVKGQCPRPLDDGDAGKSGGARRDRTADLLHAMQALSQLSYSPENSGGRVRTTRGAVKLFKSQKKGGALTRAPPSIPNVYRN
jgi:hypothetical protein